jgi:tetratricopeptide (TPR) repeat protein
MRVASESGVLQSTISAALETLYIFHMEECRENPMAPSFEETEREFLDSGLVAAFVEASALRLPDIWNQFVVKLTFTGKIFKSGLLSRRFTAALQQKFGKIATTIPTDGTVAIPIPEIAFEPAAAFFPTVEKTVQDWIDLKEGSDDQHIASNQYDEEALSAAIKQVNYFYMQFQAGRTVRTDQEMAAFVREQLRKELVSPACRTLSNFAARIENLSPSASLEIYDLAILVDSNDPVARNRRAETLRSLGRFDDALKAYEDTATAFPSDVVARTGRAETLRSLGRFDDALKAYEDTANAFPFERVVRNALTRTLIQIGRYDDVEDWLQWQPRRADQDWRDLFIWVNLLWARNERQAAISLAESAENECNFLRTRTCFQGLMAFWRLQERDLKACDEIASRVIESPKTAFEIFPLLVRAHSSGANGRPERMDQDISKVESMRPTADVVEINALLRKRFGVNSGNLLKADQDALDESLRQREQSLCFDLVA